MTKKTVMAAQMMSMVTTKCNDNDNDDDDDNENIGNDNNDDDDYENNYNDNDDDDDNEINGDDNDDDDDDDSEDFLNTNIGASISWDFRVSGRRRQTTIGTRIREI